MKPGDVVFVPPNAAGMSEDAAELVTKDGAQGVFTGTVYADQRVEVELLEGFIRVWPESLRVLG